MKYLLLILILPFLFGSSADRLQVKNNAALATEIEDIGRTIAALATEDIFLNNLGLWASSVDVDGLIDSNTIDILQYGVILSNDDAKELIHSYGILKVSDAVTLIEREVNEIEFNGFTVTNPSDKKVTITSDAVLSNVGMASFSVSGGANGKWLRIDTASMQPSGPASTATSVPYVMPFAAKVVGMVFINKDINANTDIQIYKNGILQFTWVLRSKKWATKTNGVSGIIFSPGDKISVFTAEIPGEIKATDLYFHLYYSFTSNTEQELGAGTL